MTSWRALLFVGLIVALVIGIMLQREPHYRGRSLTSWLQQCSDTPLMETQRLAEAQAAVRAMPAREVLPRLLKLVEAEDDPVSQWIIGAGDKFRISDEFGSRFIRWHSAEDFQQLGIAGFEVLETNAASAVGDLTRLLDDDAHAFPAVRCLNCNPNGDPDTGNMPRLQPDTLRGLVTDVCLKRKVRNFFARHTITGELMGETANPEDRYNLFIKEGAVIQRLLEAPSLDEQAKVIFKTYQVEGKSLTDEDWKKANEKTKKKKDETSEAEAEKKGGKKERNHKEYRDRAYRDALCWAYFDVRYFGAVVSTTGPLNGSFYGQIRGPLQVTFAESLDKILQLDFSITRCAETNEETSEKKGGDNRTMGRKHTVPYGLYRCHIHFSPAFAAKTGFNYGDLDNFLFALTRCFGDFGVDGSSARPGGMRVVALVDFQHSSALGNAPAHKVFDLVKVTGKKKPDTDVFASGSEFPGGLSDYSGSAPDGPIYIEKNKYEQVIACTDKEPSAKDGNKPASPIAAHRLVWIFPELT
jgi:CRISPR-associated protein Csd2